MQIMVNSKKFSNGSSFCAGPSLPGLATVSVWQSCGKPSTKFPHGGLVECLLISAFLAFSSWKLKKCFFWKFAFFQFFGKSATPSIWPWHYIFYSLSHLYWSLICALQGFLWVFLKVTHQNLVNSTKFDQCCTIFRAPQSGELSYCFRMAIVR